LVQQACADDVTTTIDDSDPNIKHVTGHWVHFKGSRYYNGTETLTRDAGATTLYMFNGTSISVFGTMCDPGGGNETISTYTVDGGAGSNHTVPRGTVCNQNFVNFYSSPPLSNGLHTLVITNLNKGAWFFLDFLKVTAPGNSSLSSSASLTSAASNPSGTSGESVTELTKSSKISTGAIVGIAMGAVALLLSVILGVLWWRRTRTKRWHIEGLHGDMRDADIVQPATLTPYLAPPDSLATKSSNKYNGSNPIFFGPAGSYPQALVTNRNAPTASASSVLQVSETDPIVVPSQTAVAHSPHVETVNRQQSFTTIPPAYEE